MSKVERLVFWQPIVSPHYTALLRALSQQYDVYLFVEREMSQDRLRQGWETSTITNVEIALIDPLNYTYQFDNLNDSGTVHFFSGTRAYKSIWAVFQYAMKMGAFCGLVGETFDWIGWRGKLRLLCGIVDRLLFERKIHFVLAIGELGVRWYERVGFNSSKIFEWAYFVEPPKVNGFEVNDAPNINLVYVGRLSEEKGVEWLISSLVALETQQLELHIVGDGPLREELSKSIPANLRSRVVFYGVKRRDEIYDIMRKMDYLVLPSTGKDGWGAVVNEALNVGLPCIVSRNAGASCVITDNFLGMVIDPLEENSLGNALRDIALNQTKINKERQEKIIEFSKNLSGASGALYLQRILGFIKEKDRLIKPAAPWKQLFPSK